MAMKPAAAALDLDALKTRGSIRVIVAADEAPETFSLHPAEEAGFERREELLEALRSGAVAAGILPVSELALAARRVPGLQAGVTIGAPGQVAWAVRKEDDALRKALDEYLGNVRRGPSWSRLIVKYFGDQALSVLGRNR